MVRYILPDSALCFVSVLLLLGASSCSQNTEPRSLAAEPHPGATDSLDKVQVDERVLATVNGSRIGEQDLTINLIRTLGDAYPQFSDASVQEQVLQSMIASRAIAQQSLAALSEDERMSLEKRVAQFREELLVKQYLLDNAGPQAVSAEQVKTYYEENTEEFAGKKEYLYELLTLDSAKYKHNPNDALQSLNRAKTHNNWRKLASDLQQDAFSLAHSFQTYVDDAEQSTIAEAVVKLNEGEMSRLIITNGAPYLVRLVEVTQHPPVTLADARATIRQRLLPASIKESVRAISEEVVSESNVVLSQVAE